MSNYKAHFCECGSIRHLEHVFGTYKYGTPGFRDDDAVERITRDVQEKILGAKHPDTNAMVHEMAGCWQQLIRQDTMGMDRIGKQGIYFEDVAEEMGMSLNVGHMQYGYDGKEPFEKALSESLKISDPEKAAKHFDTVADPVYAPPAKAPSAMDRLKGLLSRNDEADPGSPDAGRDAADGIGPGL